MIKQLFDYIQWLYLRLVFIDCSVADVRRFSYDYPTEAAPHVRAVTKPSSSQLELARSLYMEENARATSVLDKAKTVLTLSGILFSVMLAVSVQRPIILQGWSVVPVLLSLVVLIVTLLLLTVLLSIRTHSQPALDKDILQDDTAAHEREILVSYWIATKRNAASNDFLVDVFRATQRYLILSLLMISVAWTVSLAKYEDPKERFVAELRGDPALMRLLTGPPGPQGPAGPTRKCGCESPSGGSQSAK